VFGALRGGHTPHTYERSADGARLQSVNVDAAVRGRAGGAPGANPKPRVQAAATAAVSRCSSTLPLVGEAKHNPPGA